MGQKKLLEAILQELTNCHYHLDRLEVFYKMVHNIKENGKTGAWIEERKSKKGKASEK